MKTEIFEVVLNSTRQNCLFNNMTGSVAEPPLLGLSRFFLLVGAESRSSLFKAAPTTSFRQAKQEKPCSSVKDDLRAFYTGKYDP